MKDIIVRLKALCAAANVTLTEKGPGHWHVEGTRLVNYYPLSAKRTAYVAGSTKGQKHVTPEQAVALARPVPVAPAALPAPVDESLPPPWEE